MVVGAASRYTAPNAGSTSSACSILVRNAKPTSAPASSSHRVLACSKARITAYAAPTSSSTSSASGLLNRNISAATGVSASTAPATSPAPGPNQRRTEAYSTATAATPASAWGTRMLHAFSPNARTDSAISQIDPGVLSTVIELAASVDPKCPVWAANCPSWVSSPSCCCAVRLWPWCLRVSVEGIDG